MLSVKRCDLRVAAGLISPMIEAAGVTCHYSDDNVPPAAEFCASLLRGWKKLQPQYPALRVQARVITRRGEGIPLVVLEFLVRGRRPDILSLEQRPLCGTPKGYLWRIQRQD